MSYSTRCLKNKVSHFARRRTADLLLEIKSEILPIDYFINKKFESSQLSNIYIYIYIYDIVIRNILYFICCKPKERSGDINHPPFI